MKKSKIALFILTILISTLIKAQNCDFKTDTVYYVNIRGTLTNGRPVFTWFTIKDLDILHNYLEKNRDDFLCNVYQSAVFVTEPYLGFVNKINCLGEDKDEEFKNFNKRLRHLNKKCKEVIKIQNNQYETLHLSIIRLIGEFWIIPFNIDQMNNMTESIPVKSECYKAKYYCEFKKIKNIIPLTKDEIKLLASSEELYRK